MKIRLNIDGYNDRKGCVSILTEIGYKVWIETEAQNLYWTKKFFVCFEYYEELDPKLSLLVEKEEPKA